jgi:hypothetical protein
MATEFGQSRACTGFVYMCLTVGRMQHAMITRQAVAGSGRQWQAVAGSGRQWQAVAARHHGPAYFFSMMLHDVHKAELLLCMPESLDTGATTSPTLRLAANVAGGLGCRLCLTRANRGSLLRDAYDTTGCWSNYSSSRRDR